jgi:hypothetical protein
LPLLNLLLLHPDSPWMPPRFPSLPRNRHPAATGLSLGLLQSS